MCRMSAFHLLAALIVAGLTACDTTSRDITSPDPAVRHELGALASLGRPLVLTDGHTVTTLRFEAGLRLGGEISAAAITGTTQCGGGHVEIDPVTGQPSIEDGVLSGGTYDDIEVPPDEICVLDGVTVLNSVRALANARLFVSGSQVGADVLGLSAFAVQLNDETTVGGDLDVQGGGDPLFASCAVDNSTITGNLSCTNQNPGSPVIRAEQGPVSIGGNADISSNLIPAGNVLLLLNTNIGNNADVSRNTGGGFKSVNGNTVTNKLECKKNDTPIVGGPNAANKAKGQCF